MSSAPPHAIENYENGGARNNSSCEAPGVASPMASLQRTSRHRSIKGSTNPSCNLVNLVSVVLLSLLVSSNILDIITPNTPTENLVGENNSSFTAPVLVRSRRMDSKVHPTGGVDVIASQSNLDIEAQKNFDIESQNPESLITLRLPNSQKPQISETRSGMKSNLASAQMVKLTTANNAKSCNSWVSTNQVAPVFQMASLSLADATVAGGSSSSQNARRIEIRPTAVKRNILRDSCYRNQTNEDREVVLDHDEKRRLKETELDHTLEQKMRELGISDRVENHIVNFENHNDIQSSRSSESTHNPPIEEEEKAEKKQAAHSTAPVVESRVETPHSSHFESDSQKQNNKNQHANGFDLHTTEVNIQNERPEIIPNLLAKPTTENSVAILFLREQQMLRLFLPLWLSPREMLRLLLTCKYIQAVVLGSPGTNYFEINRDVSSFDKGLKPSWNILQYYRKHKKTAYRLLNVDEDTGTWLETSDNLNEFLKPETTSYIDFRKFSDIYKRLRAAERKILHKRELEAWRAAEVRTGYKILLGMCAVMTGLVGIYWYVGEAIASLDE